MVTGSPSRHVKIVGHWEKRDEGLIDPAPLPGEEDPEAWPQAVSQPQVYWAGSQLRKAGNGAPVPQSIPEPEALANTPLADLPAPTGKKPIWKSTAKKPAREAKEA